MSEENNESKISATKMAEMWNEHHENILRQWGEQSACYRYMHHRAFLMYKILSLRFNLPVIVLSTITGTANFAQSTLPESIRGAAPAVIGGMNLIAGLIATIMQFLKINELMENHRTAALGHGTLSRNIRLQLALPREERNKEGLKFVDECKAIYDSLLEQSPSIPKHILVSFDEEYYGDGKFTKPEILIVRPIPFLKTPKTYDPVRAITVNTPFEGIGKMLAPSDNEESDEEEEDSTQSSEELEDAEQGISKE
jgi:hypothetical protein|tara:strand:- start:2108 stop:2869 length:762 start_codon:yes stop_codon:yes gene_type:complete